MTYQAISRQQLADSRQNPRQAGVTLLLAILVLSSIMAISFSLATILFIEIRSSGDLIRTEPALYGANGVAEEAIFNVKRSACVSGSCNYTASFGNNVTLPNPPTTSATTSPIFQDKVIPNSSFSSNSNQYYFYDATNHSSPSSGYGKVKLTYLDIGNPDPLTVYVCEFDVNNPVDPTGVAANSYNSTPCTDPSDTLVGNNHSYWKDKNVIMNSSVFYKEWSLDPTKQQEVILFNPNITGNLFVSMETFDADTVTPKGLPYSGLTAVEINTVNGSVGRHLRVIVPNAAGNTPTNYAASANGGVASVSSCFLGDCSGPFPPANVNDGDRLGNKWGSGSSFGGGWNDNGILPSWVEIDFSGSKTISEIDVYTLANCLGSCTSIDILTPADVFGISDFQVQYDNGGTWQTVGSITGNILSWNKFTFSPVTTGKIRVNITGYRQNYSRLIEVEAY